MKSKMSKRTKKLIINISILAVLTAVTLTILFLSYRELNFNNIWIFLRASKPLCITAAFICMILFIVFEGLALWVIARRLGHKSKLRGAMAYSSADVYYSAITPSASGGQPASMFYMMRDGMSGGIAGFTLVFNLMAYTAAIIVMGIFAFIAGYGIFGSLGSGFAQTLVIVGFVLQAVLLGFFIMCIMWSKAILKMGNGAISLLHKIKIIKKPDKWRKKWQEGVDKYSASRAIIKEHPMLFFEALLLNLAQRVSQTLIPCFICFAVSDNANFLDLFVMQTFVLLGYNMVPIPGGVGAYEYMYLQTYCIAFDESFILSAMMVSRAISYYVSLIISGVYTLVYHSVGLKDKQSDTPDGMNDWQYKMYSEGEEWCGDEMSPDSQTYSEGENSDDTDETDQSPKDTDVPTEQPPDESADKIPPDEPPPDGAPPSGEGSPLSEMPTDADETPPSETTYEKTNDE